MRRVLVLNGPNLASLGKRQPDIYGNGSLNELVTDLMRFGAALGVEVTHRQTDDEAELISLVSSPDADGIIINPGALTHTSRALGDAVRSSGLPTVEVHISDIRRREPWRSVSMVEDACVLSICGRGRTGYRDAIRHLVNRSAAPFEAVRYGPHPANLGELRSGREPGLWLLVHGGGWRPQYGRDIMESLAVDLNRRGLTSWNIGYRRSGEGGGWPGSAHDVLTALDYAARLGQPMTLVGHSAGAYLALWAADRTSSTPSAVIALAPMIDLELAARGGELAPDASKLLEDGAPKSVWADHIRTIAVHGRQDALVAVEHSTGLVGHNSEVRIIEGGHFDVLDPAKPHWSPIVEMFTSGAQTPA